MEFKLLGPLVALRDGRELPIGAAKQRALLAMLLLHGGEAVSTDSLIDALWGERPPDTAHKALQVYVSQLRKALAAGNGRRLLVTRAPGYALELPDGALDIAVFERLTGEARAALAAGDVAAAAAGLRDALALWRGAPLADLRYEAFAQPHIARLEEQRLAALEDRIDADLALRRHATLVGELEALVAEHPLRERLRGQLMLALYRSGRQADALAAFASARHELVDELGLEPGRELRELHGAILRQDDTLDGAPPAVGAPEADEPPPPPTETPRELRKTVTALHVSLVGRTADGTAVDPEAARSITTRAHTLVAARVERHGGVVEGVSGSGVTAVFGLPGVHEDDALRAARAALETRTALASLSADLRPGGAVRLDYRIGVATGEVLTGGPASGVIGEPLETAPAIGRAGLSGDVVLDNATCRLLRGWIAVRGREDGGPCVLTAVFDRPAEAGAEPAMVGRRRELRRLDDAFEQALTDRSCHLFTVLGQAGVGKSRLVQEFLGRLRDAAVVARGRCLPYGEGITFWPLLEAVKEAAGIAEDDGADASRAALVTLLDDDPDAELVAGRVTELTGLAEASGNVAEGADAVRRLFAALARRRATVVVFDDIHWGASTFLDLVEHIADWTRDAPLLLVCIARPELLDVRPGWGGGKINATSVLLEPLSVEECSELVDTLGGSALDATARARVIAAAEGNPLFVEELLALALDEPGGDALAVPPTIQALLAARLDRLADDQRAALETASVEGKGFHEGWVAAATRPGDQPAVAARLGDLVRKDLVRPDRPLFAGERAYRFRHLLIRDAAYASIPKAARATLHERYADWLEQKAGDRITEYEEIAGYHLEQAVRYRTQVGVPDTETRELTRRGAARLGAAGRRAFVRSDAPAAINLISRAAALLPRDDPARIELVPSVRVAQGLGAELDWADAILADAAGTADERLRAHALVQRGFFSLFTKPDTQPGELVAIAEDAARVFAERDDELGLARAWRLIAQARYLARSAAGCAEASEQALVHARRAGDTFEIKEIVEWLAVALGLGSTPADEAADRCAELREEFAQERFVQITLLAVQAHLEALRGRPAVAHQLLALARRTAGDERTLRRVAYYSIYTTFVLDNPKDAELELRAGLEALGQVAEKTNSCTLAAQLARTLCDQGRFAEAEEWTHQSEENARANDIMANILWRAARARALAGLGKFGPALAIAEEAVAYGATSDFLAVHADALMDQAEVLRLAGADDEATSAVEHAIALYERKGCTSWAARARAVLA